METFGIGAISGMTGVLLSHPIDTVKTNIQKYGILQTNQLNNFAKLYRGIWSPLIGVGFEKAIVFGMYEKTQNVFINQNRSITIVNAIAGGIAGFSASFLVTPYERIKILLQNGSNVQKDTFQLRSLFRGLSMTFTREVPGFAIYFSVYEGLKYNLHTKPKRELGHLNSFIYGGLSGASAWIFIYPQDRIKTLIQSTTNITLPKNKIAFYWNFIRQNGGLYKGFSWALYRAILLHSGTFAMMEFLTSKSALLNEFTTL